MTDLDDGTRVSYDLPEASMAGVVESAKDESGQPIKEPGATDEEDIAAKVGWEQRFGWPVDSVLSGDSMLDHTTWLEGKIPDTMFGGNTPLPLIPLLKCRYGCLYVYIKQTGITMQPSLSSLVSPPGWSLCLVVV